MALCLMDTTALNGYVSIECKKWLICNDYGPFLLFLFLLTSFRCMNIHASGLCNLYAIFILIYMGLYVSNVCMMRSDEIHQPQYGHHIYLCRIF
ncbi:hypothetical protein BDV38DRAFT_31055 [Aspergillus pseudotamarii]|uniref:Uncharacterized protein n=1 Tax=Aspergillus pseudotamarii TaxID=132259 RepID=A0A5N6SDH6_ASPPS|nr:uncharacterized protein BDV38DRAFT_31055 [Aspergillus pseudotamarii]KAE8131154.1 hypothetical protein BDV38DRAFT_31055 [Aspergillus pseudotamarii]